MVNLSKANLPRGFAYVTFEEHSDAEAARVHMDGVRNVYCEILTFVNAMRTGPDRRQRDRVPVYCCSSSPLAAAAPHVPAPWWPASLANAAVRAVFAQTSEQSLTLGADAARLAVVAILLVGASLRGMARIRCRCA